MSGDASGPAFRQIPSQPLGEQHLTLYAQWHVPDCSWITPGADLRRYNFANSPNLKNGDLRGADLRNSNLSGALFEGADMSAAQLQGANLSGAHLPGVDLGSANLEGAHLSYANLQGADLRLSCLVGATPDQANLQDASIAAALMSFGSPAPFIGTPVGLPVNDPMNGCTTLAGLPGLP